MSILLGENGLNRLNKGFCGTGWETERGRLGDGYTRRAFLMHIWSFIKILILGSPLQRFRFNWSEGLLLLFVFTAPQVILIFNQGWESLNPVNLHDTGDSHKNPCDQASKQRALKGKDTAAEVTEAGVPRCSLSRLGPSAFLYPYFLACPMRWRLGFMTLAKGSALVSPSKEPGYWSSSDSFLEERTPLPSHCNSNFCKHTIMGISVKGEEKP